MKRSEKIIESLRVRLLRGVELSIGLFLGWFPVGFQFLAIACAFSIDDGDIFSSTNNLSSLLPKA